MVFRAVIRWSVRDGLAILLSLSLINVLHFNVVCCYYHGIVLMFLCEYVNSVLGSRCGGVLQFSRDMREGVTVLSSHSYASPPGEFRGGGGASSMEGAAGSEGRGGGGGWKASGEGGGSGTGRIEVLSAPAAAAAAGSRRSRRLRGVKSALDESVEPDSGGHNSAVEELMKRKGSMRHHTAVQAKAG